VQKEKKWQIIGKINSQKKPSRKVGKPKKKYWQGEKSEICRKTPKTDENCLQKKINSQKKKVANPKKKWRTKIMRKY
jgi:hypothetical protein